MTQEHKKVLEGFQSQIIGLTKEKESLKEELRKR